LVTGTETRNERRARERLEAELRKAARVERAAEARAAMEADKAAFAGDYLPPGGERGPATLRALRATTVQTHRATTATLSAAYPFLAEGTLGSEGTLVGHDAYSRSAFCFDPWVLYERGVLTNPNMTLAGVIGRGKSALMKSLVTRSLAFGRRAYVPGDPKGEWTPVARAVGGAVIALGPGASARLNPLDAGTRPERTHLGEPVTDALWEHMVTRRRNALIVALAAALLGRRLRPEEYQAIAAAIDAAAARRPDPLLPDVVDHLVVPDEARPVPRGVDSHAQLAEYGRQVGYTLGRLVHGDLAGMFDGPSTVVFDARAPMLTVDLSALGAESGALPAVMTCTSAWMEAALRDPGAGKRWVVYDEAWKVMRHPTLLARMQEQWKLSRHWGLANALVVHRLSDLHSVGESGSESRALAEGLMADTSTRVVYRQETDQIPPTVASLGLTSASGGVLDRLVRGQGLWQVGDRTFVVNHHLTRSEKTLFDTDAAMRQNA